QEVLIRSQQGRALGRDLGRWRRELLRDLAPHLLQALDGLARLGVESAQRVRVVLGLGCHVADLCERGAQRHEATDAEQLGEVGDAVVLVVVRRARGFGKKSHLVVVAHRTQRRAGERRHFLGAPPHHVHPSIASGTPALTVPRRPSVPWAQTRHEGALTRRDMTTSHTTLRRLAISLVPVLFVAGLAGSCVPHPTESDPLAQYYKQDLAFGSCAEFATTALEDLVFDAVEEAECAYLQVPVDYEDPRGETAQVAVTRLAADGNPIGSLVVNPGGPGGSGLLQGVVADANLAGTPITENFDIIGMDPRGVGASTPSADCVSDESADQGGNLFPQAALQGSWSAERTQELVERCAEASGGENFLANVGTRDAARDLDVLREVLGDEKLSYLGQSYGTRLGAVYAEMFPENVRALVLDGAADPTLGTVERRITQYTGVQAAVDSMATDCSKEEDCILGTDPDQAVEKFQSITRPLIDEPITTAAGRTVDYNVAVGAVTAGLYNSEQWPDVLAGIEELAAGRADTLLA